VARACVVSTAILALQPERRAKQARHDSRASIKLVPPFVPGDTPHHASMHEVRAQWFELWAMIQYFALQMFKHKDRAEDACSPRSQAAEMVGYRSRATSSMRAERGTP
jgi:hypothetical protein